MKKKTKKTKTIAFFLSVGITVFLLTVFFVSDKTLANPEGWGDGAWNNSLLQYIGNIWQVVDNPTDSMPTIGKLSSSRNLCGNALTANYSINFGDADKDTGARPINGSAWFGIGSEEDAWDQSATCSGGDGDLPSLGFLDFSVGSPYFCSGTDCHSAMWHKAAADQIDTDKTGYLDGWANVRSMGNSGWVRLKDPSGAHYGVTSSSTGLLSGFGWNSGEETDPSLVGNSGLGWINMDGLKVGDCKLGPRTATLCTGQKITDAFCDPLKYCSGDGTLSCAFTGDTSWTCSNTCGDATGNISFVVPEIGVCGSLEGKYVCDPKNPPTADKLCSDVAMYNNDLNSSSVTATWTCGNTCGTKVTCSASARCGWIETAP